MKIIKSVFKAAAALVIHEHYKNKAVRKARQEMENTKSIDGNFYVTLPSQRDWIQIDSGINNQTHIVNVLKLQSYIKNFGGENLKTIDSTEDTRIYFKLNRVAAWAMIKDLEKHFKGITMGESKFRKY